MMSDLHSVLPPAVPLLSAIALCTETALTLSAALSSTFRCLYESPSSSTLPAGRSGPDKTKAPPSTAQQPSMLPDSITKLLEVLGPSKSTAPHGEHSGAGLDVAAAGRASPTQCPRGTQIAAQSSPGLRCMTSHSSKGAAAAAAELLKPTQPSEARLEVLSAEGAAAAQQSSSPAPAVAAVFFSQAAGSADEPGSPEPGPNTPDTSAQRTLSKLPSNASDRADDPHSHQEPTSPSRSRACSVEAGAHPHKAPPQHAHLAPDACAAAPAPSVSPCTVAEAAVDSAQVGQQQQQAAGGEDVSPPCTPVGADTTPSSATPKVHAGPTVAPYTEQTPPHNTALPQRARPATDATAAAAAAMAKAALVAAASFQRPASRSPPPSKAHSTATSEADMQLSESRRTSKQGSFGRNSQTATPPIDTQTQQPPAATLRSASATDGSKPQPRSNALLNYISVPTEPSASSTSTSVTGNSAATASERRAAHFLPDWTTALQEASIAAARASGTLPPTTSTTTNTTTTTQQRRAHDAPPTSTTPPPQDTCVNDPRVARPQAPSSYTPRRPHAPSSDPTLTQAPVTTAAPWGEHWAPLIPLSDLIPATLPPPRADSVTRALTTHTSNTTTTRQFDSSSDAQLGLAATAELVEAIWRSALPPGVAATGYGDVCVAPSDASGASSRGAPGAAAAGVWDTSAAFLPKSSGSGPVLQGVLPDWRALQNSGAAAAAAARVASPAAYDDESLASDASAVNNAVAAASALLDSELGPFAWAPCQQGEAGSGIAGPWPAWLASLMAATAGTDTAARDGGFAAAGLQPVQTVAVQQYAGFAAGLPAQQLPQQQSQMQFEPTLAHAVLQDEMSLAQTAADLAQLLAMQNVDALARVSNPEGYVQLSSPPHRASCQQIAPVQRTDMPVANAGQGFAAGSAAHLAAQLRNRQAAFTPLSPGEPLPGPPYAVAPVGVVMRRERSVTGDSPAHWRQAWIAEPDRDMWPLSGNTPRRPPSQASSTTPRHGGTVRALFSPLGARRRDPHNPFSDIQPAVLLTRSPVQTWPQQADARPTARSLLSESVAGMRDCTDEFTLRNAPAAAPAPAQERSGLTAGPASDVCESPSTLPWAAVASILEEPEEWQSSSLLSVFSPLRAPRDTTGTTEQRTAEPEQQQQQQSVQRQGPQTSPPRDIVLPPSLAPLASPSALSYTAPTLPPAPVSVLSRSYGSAGLHPPVPPRTGASAADGQVIPPPIPKPPIMYRRVIFPSRTPSLNGGEGPPRRSESASDPGQATGAAQGGLVRRLSVPDVPAPPAPEALRVSASEDTSHFVIPPNLAHAFLTCAAVKSANSVDSAPLSAPSNIAPGASRVRKSDGDVGTQGAAGAGASRSEAGSGVGTGHRAQIGMSAAAQAAVAAVPPRSAHAKATQAALPAQPPLSPTARGNRRAPVFTVPVTSTVPRPRTTTLTHVPDPHPHPSATVLTAQELRAVDARLAQVRSAAAHAATTSTGPYAINTHTTQRDSAADSHGAGAAASDAVSTRPASVSEGGQPKAKAVAPVSDKRNKSTGGASGASGAGKAYEDTVKPDLVWGQAASSALVAAQAAMARPLPPALMVAARGAPSKPDGKAAATGRRRATTGGGAGNAAGEPRAPAHQGAAHSGGAAAAQADILPPMPNITDNLLRSVESALQAIHARGDGARGAQPEARTKE